MLDLEWFDRKAVKAVSQFKDKTVSDLVKLRVIGIACLFFSLLRCASFSSSLWSSINYCAPPWQINISLRGLNFELPN